MEYGGSVSQHVQVRVTGVFDAIVFPRRLTVDHLASFARSLATESDSRIYGRQSIWSPKPQSLPSLLFMVKLIVGVLSM